MTVRSVDTQTGEETSRPLTQAELDQAAVNTADEMARNSARIDHDAELDAALEAANTIPEIKAALLGRARGRGPK